MSDEISIKQRGMVLVLDYGRGLFIQNAEDAAALTRILINAIPVSCTGWIQTDEVLIRDSTKVPEYLFRSLILQDKPEEKVPEEAVVEEDDKLPF